MNNNKNILLSYLNLVKDKKDGKLKYLERVLREFGEFRKEREIAIQFLDFVLNIKLHLLIILILSFDDVMAQHVETTLISDGPSEGLSAYELIRRFGGPKPIESPDLYPGNHPGVKHIFERTDDVVGHHFVFTIHKHLDKDRNKYVKFSDRQRNEIKVYDKSSDDLKGFEGDALSYAWKFKIGDGMSVSKNFTHLFQLKSKDEGIGTPMLTISGVDLKGAKYLLVSHVAIDKPNYLAFTSWEDVLGKWLKVEVDVKYANQGRLSMRIHEVVSGKQVLSFNSDNIDMWRGTKSHHFVRPKWGIYRSLKSKHMLREQEEQVSFADFRVVKFGEIE